MQYSSQNQVQSPAGYMTLHELCSMLSISPATGRNWIRLGKLKPQISSDKNIWFSLSYVHSLQRKLMEKDNAVLKSRRNKGCDHLVTNPFTIPTHNVKRCAQIGQTHIQ